MANFGEYRDVVGHLIGASSRSGWAAARLPIASAEEANRLIKSAFIFHEHAPQSNRKSGEYISVLNPSSKEDAVPNSISAKVGTGRQPLHVDGSHLPQPPKFIAMWSWEVSTTPTLLYSDPIKDLCEAAGQGVFMVRPGEGGKDFLATAHDSKGLRFDPLCMTPMDTYSSRITRAMENPSEDRVGRFEWDVPGKVLLIRNRMILHAREAVSDGDENRAIYRMACSERQR